MAILPILAATAVLAEPVVEPLSGGAQPQSKGEAKETAKQEIDALAVELDTDPGQATTCSDSRAERIGKLADKAHEAFATCAREKSECDEKLRKKLASSLFRTIKYFYDRRTKCPKAASELWRFLDRINIPASLPLGASEAVLRKVADASVRGTNGRFDEGTIRDALEITLHLNNPVTRKRFLGQLEALKREGNEVPEVLTKAITDNQNVAETLLEAGRSYVALAFQFTRELDYEARMQPDFAGLLHVVIARKSTDGQVASSRTKGFENAIKEILTAQTGGGIEAPKPALSDQEIVREACSCRSEMNQHKCAGVLVVEMDNVNGLVDAKARLILNNQALGDSCKLEQIPAIPPEDIANTSFQPCDSREPACVEQIEAAAVLLRSLRYSVFGSLPFLDRGRTIEYLGEPLDPKISVVDTKRSVDAAASEILACRVGLQVLRAENPCGGEFRTGLVGRLLKSYDGEIGKISSTAGDPRNRALRLLIQGDGKECEASLWRADTLLYSISTRTDDAGLAKAAGAATGRVLGEFYRDAVHAHKAVPQGLPHGPPPIETQPASPRIASRLLLPGVEWWKDDGRGKVAAGIIWSIGDVGLLSGGALLVGLSINERNNFAHGNGSLDHATNLEYVGFGLLGAFLLERIGWGLWGPSGSAPLGQIPRSTEVRSGEGAEQLCQ